MMARSPPGWKAIAVVCIWSERRWALVATCKWQEKERFMSEFSLGENIQNSRSGEKDGGSSLLVPLRLC